MPIPILWLARIISFGDEGSDASTLALRMGYSSRARETALMINASDVTFWVLFGLLASLRRKAVMLLMFSSSA